MTRMHLEDRLSPLLLGQVHNNPAIEPPRAQQRFVELARRYGARALMEYAEQLMRYAERRVRDEIGTWPRGAFEAEGFMDDDGVDRGVPIRLHARVIGKDAAHRLRGAVR